MIEVQDLTKKFGLFTAVNQISFQARQGEVVGLLGPNGAGKTTTMRMLTAYMPPTSGSIRISGFDALTESMEVRKRVGYLPENIPTYPDMTVREYIRFWADLRGTPNARKRTDEVIERVQLTDRRNSLIRNISKGMRQRLGLAQAIVHQPEVIILDEPTIGIDPQQVIEVRETVRQLGQDHTLLFSTHILSEAEQVCDRVLIIDRGRIVAEGAPKTLRQQLQDGAHLYVEVAAPLDDALSAYIQQLDGVLTVTPQAEGFIVRVQPEIDLRAALSQHLHHGGHTLLEMRPLAMTLEDIFLDIVGKAH